MPLERNTKKCYSGIYEKQSNRNYGLCTYVNLDGFYILKSVTKDLDILKHYVLSRG